MTPLNESSSSTIQPMSAVRASRLLYKFSIFTVTVHALVLKTTSLLRLAGVVELKLFEAVAYSVAPNKGGAGE
ncbi:unnamed protein product [Phytophthora lilii]|uniref:Unnamed protein product n=1 Tax=Phytophthora lilii TaxID=2077276 RepID=A0A9W6TE22_9STRA|nr:unnamed protein product [Phytophthora lilii]